MKKLLSVLISIGILISGAAVVSAGEAGPAESDYKIQAVFELGFMTEDENGGQLLEEQVTRMDLAIAVYRLLNYGNPDEIPTAQAAYYSDIDVYHYGAGYVQYLTDLGYIGGYEDGTFRPDQPITLDECAALLLRCAGYADYLAQASKPALMVANRAGLLDGVSAQGGDSITRADEARMIYNLLFMNCMSPKGATDEYLVYREEPFLEAVLGLSYSDGILDGVGGMSLYGDISDGDVSVNETIYQTESSYSEQYLGYHVRVIYTKKEKRVAALLPTNKNSVLVLDADLISGYGSHTYEYWRSSAAAAVSRARVSKTADMVYNGCCSFDTERMVPNYGSVTLVDNNGDGVFEVVKISELESRIVSSVSVQENLLTFKNLDENGIMQRLELSNFDTCHITDAAGKPIALSRINACAAVTIQRSEGMKRISILLANQVVSGTVETMKTEEDETHITVNKTEYKLAPDYYISGWELGVGFAVELYLDVNGRVAGVFKLASADAWRYGYISQIAEAADDRVALKMLTEDGRLDVLLCEDKVTIDGTVYRDSKQIYRALQNAYNQFEETSGPGDAGEQVTTRMVRYYVTAENQIKKLDTPIRQSLYELSVPEDYDKDNCFMIRAKGKLYFKSAMASLKTVYGQYMDIPGDVYGMAETKVFLLPEDLQSAEDSDYMVKTMTTSGFSEMFYYASGYNCEIEGPECNVVAVRKTTGTTATRMMVVDDIGRQVSENGNVTDAVMGYSGSTYQNYAVKENSTIPAGRLQKGDVIIYEIENNLLSIKEIAYRLGGGGVLNDTDSYHPNDGGIHFNIPYRVLKGKAARITGNYMQLVPENQPTELMGLPSTVIFYDRANSQVFAGSIYDVRTADAFGSQADVLLISTRSGTVTEAVAVRSDA